MLDEIIIAKLMKHVGFMASELLNFLAWSKVQIADSAFRSELRFTKSSNDCLAEGLACPLDSRLSKVCL